MGIEVGSPVDLGNGSYRVGASRHSSSGKIVATGSIVVNIASYFGEETDPAKQAYALASAAFFGNPNLLEKIPPVQAPKKRETIKAVDKDGNPLPRDDLDRDPFQPSDKDLKEGATEYNIVRE